MKPGSEKDHPRYTTQGDAGAAIKFAPGRPLPSAATTSASEHLPCTATAMGAAGKDGAMTPRSSAAARAIAIAVLASAVAAGCTATRTVRTPAPRPLPTSTITSAAALIARAAGRECAQFSTTNDAINGDVSGLSADSVLFPLISEHGSGWQHALAAAAQAGSGPGVPPGANIARSIAAYIAHDASDLGTLRTAIGHDRTRHVSRAWDRMFTDLAATQTQCSAF